MNGPVYEAALQAYDAGLCPIRAKLNGTKAPLGEGGRWEQFQAERPDLETVDAWFADGHEGMGLVCGEVSGGLEMFELEGRFVADGGLARWKAALADAGLADLWAHITNGYAERTPSNGVHVCYRCDEVSGNLVLARDEDRKVLIETRGEGGFTITAPSNGRTHPSGEAWVLLKGGFESIVTISPAQRAAVHAVARGFDLAPDQPAERKRPIGDPGDSGTLPRFDLTTDQVLEAAGFVVHTIARNGDVHWTRPGKPVEDGSSLTVWADNGRATPWSSSIVMPREFLTGHRLLTAWQLHVALNHGGDFTEAGRVWHREHPKVSIVSRIPPAGVDPDTGEAVDVRQNDATSRLPDAFWKRTRLAHIRQAAHSRRRSADAVLHAVLARVAAACCCSLVLPPIVGSAKPLCYFGGLVAKPGIGKTDAIAIAGELVPLPFWVQDMPPGSGEGLAELLFEQVEETDERGRKATVKRQTRHNVFLAMDEGQVLGDLGRRNGATLLPTLRSIWSGGRLGQANANRERFRPVPEMSYNYGLVVGFQAATAGDILSGVDVGDPQRFGWAYATDPTVPDGAPAWPGPLDWSPGALFTERLEFEVDPAVVAEIEAADLARVREEDEVDPLDAQGGLYRLKVAGLLAVLDDRRNITTEDWALAGMVKAASDAVRANIVSYVARLIERREEATSARLANRAVAAEDAKRKHRVVECAERIVAKVTSDPGGWTRGRLRAAMGSRDVWHDACEHALAEGRIDERAESSHTSDDKRRLWPVS